MSEVPTAAPVTASVKLGRVRWRVCALLLAATTINYVDRQVLGVLAPFLQTQIGWNEIQYGYIVTAFQAAYALGLLCSGAVIDRFGTRLGYAMAIGIWSLAAMGMPWPPAWWALRLRGFFWAWANRAIFLRR